jgi:hypothetical protein
MKKIYEVWTLVYKEENKDPLSYTYNIEKDALSAKLMLEDADGGELCNERGEVDGMFNLEWCHLIKGKFIQTILNN